MLCRWCFLKRHKQRQASLQLQRTRNCQTPLSTAFPLPSCQARCGLDRGSRRSATHGPAPCSSPHPPSSSSSPKVDTGISKSGCAAADVPSSSSSSVGGGKMPCPDPRPQYKPLSCAEDDKKFPYVEVWGPDGKSKRFALGTRASFVVDRFNKKLVDAVKPVVCVAAFKYGEEPVEFGPDAPLMSMCEWDLRVVQEAPFQPIGVGGKIPNGELSYLDDDAKLQSYCIYDLVREKTVVFFGVPGAFTPTCSLKHVPGFLERAEEIMDRGVKEIVCVTVNDPWVVKEWEKTYPENKHIKFLCDGSATWTKSIGLELDLIERGMGVRSRRYCLLIDDTIVKIANIEADGGLETSTADRLTAELKAIKGGREGGSGSAGC